MKYSEIKAKGYTVRTIIGTPEECYPQLVGKLVGVIPETFGFQYTKTVTGFEECNETEIVPMWTLHEYLHLSTEKNPKGWLSTHQAGRKSVSLHYIIEKSPKTI